MPRTPPRRSGLSSGQRRRAARTWRCASQRATYPREVRGCQSFRRRTRRVRALLQVILLVSTRRSSSSRRCLAGSLLEQRALQLWSRRLSMAHSRATNQHLRKVASHHRRFSSTAVATALHGSCWRCARRPRRRPRRHRPSALATKSRAPLRACSASSARTRACSEGRSATRSKECARRARKGVRRNSKGSTTDRATRSWASAAPQEARRAPQGALGLLPARRLLRAQLRARRSRGGRRGHAVQYAILSCGTEGELTRVAYE
jgi:hypothetical protein